MCLWGICLTRASIPAVCTSSESDVVNRGYSHDLHVRAMEDLETQLSALNQRLFQGSETWRLHQSERLHSTEYLRQIFFRTLQCRVPPVTVLNTTRTGKVSLTTASLVLIKIGSGDIPKMVDSSGRKLWRPNPYAVQ